MKSKIGGYLLSPEFQASVGGAVVRRLVRATRRWYDYSPRFLLDSQAADRPHYAYCMLGAADLARRLGRQRISVIEFGVAGGNGLVFVRDFARAVTQRTGVEFEIYGFDTGKGMPPPQGVADLPYWFQEAQYVMDEPALRNRVPEAKLLIGEIEDTLPTFLEQHRPAPVGAVFNDVDYFSSTMDSFRLFEAAAQQPDHFLPRVFIYMDDILGTELEMYGPYNGQLAAIEEFNRRTESAKIHLNQNLLSQAHLRYRYQIYYAHLFSHPLYSEYIGGAQQDALQDALSLRPAGR